MAIIIQLQSRAVQEDMHNITIAFLHHPKVLQKHNGYCIFIENKIFLQPYLMSSNIDKIKVSGRVVGTDNTFTIYICIFALILFQSLFQSYPNQFQNDFLSDITQKKTFHNSSTILVSLNQIPTMIIALPHKGDEIEMHTPFNTPIPNAFDIASDLYNIQATMLSANDSPLKISTKEYSVDKQHEKSLHIFKNTNIKSAKHKNKRKGKQNIIQHKHSCLKSDNNPLTIYRRSKLKQGKTLKVHFDEFVVVCPVVHQDSVSRCNTKIHHENVQKNKKKNKNNVASKTTTFMVMIAIIVLICI